MIILPAEAIKVELYFFDFDVDEKAGIQISLYKQAVRPSISLPDGHSHRIQ
jgi:hypothetical protein